MSESVNGSGGEIHLDIGGEGRHPWAWNVNPSRTKTLGADAGEPIPRLIVAKADALPFAENSVHSAIVERTPLSRAAARELRRVIRPDGQIVLRHVPLPDRDRHQLALEILGGSARRRETEINGQAVIETTIVFS